MHSDKFCVYTYYVLCHDVQIVPTVQWGAAIFDTTGAA